MKRILALAAAFALSGNFALAAITADDLVRTYQDSGYIWIEVTTGVTQIKVEAIKEGQKIEVVYDIETGTALTTETSTLDPSIVVMPRVEVKVADDDEFAAEDLNDAEGEDDGISGVTDDEDDDDGVNGVTDDEGDDDGVSGVTDDESDGDNSGAGSNDDESDNDRSANDSGDDSSEDQGDDHGDDD